jgi:ATP-binding cassette, subfamily B, bacterial
VVSVEDIATVPIFSTLDPDQLATIANWFDAEHIGEGVRLVGEGSHGYSFFVLAEGTAAVTAEGEKLATLQAGDFFGEVAMLGSGRRTASVTSTAPVRLLVMFGTEFRQLQDAYPEIADRITLAMKERVGDVPPDEPEGLRIAPSRSGS